MTNNTKFTSRPNRLLAEPSAYLRSAAYQPVEWYPFGPEAFAAAVREDKPILLDIGAAWCHWCHVIDRESYENPDIAALINEHFIPIKVDRDERPDIDARYQVAVQLMSGQGGWPLTVFLQPDGQPFFGGTYFPPEERGGRVGMKTLLARLSEIYSRHPAEMEQTTRALTARVKQVGVASAERGEVSEATYQRLAGSVRHRFNPDDGGFEVGAPKFLHPGAIELALLQWSRTGDDEWRGIVEKTLLAMGRGGITDQIGGGFHRYATDKEWIVPHFEKLSADNALMLENYVHAYRATGNQFFREVAENTLSFIFTVLADKENSGFYAAQDADVDLHDDGDYWTWEYNDFLSVPALEEAVVLLHYYGVSEQGNMPETGRSVLHIAVTPEQLAEELKLPLDEVVRKISSGRGKLAQAREKRTPPQIDTNKYTGWNALLISACLQAGTLLERHDAIDFALRSVDMLLKEAYTPEHGAYHAVFAGAGARLPGFFEDQVYLSRAFLDAFAVSGNPRHLAAARRLLDLCIDEYWDEEGGGFFDIAREQREATTNPILAQPRKVIEDNPTPSPNAIAALVLDRAWLLTADERYHAYAGKTLAAFATHAPDYGPYASYYGLALYFHLHPTLSTTIIGHSDHEDTQRLRQAALHVYLPGHQVAVYSPDNPTLLYPPAENGNAVAYVCVGQHCSAPVFDADKLRDALANIRLE